MLVSLLATACADTAPQTPSAGAADAVGPDRLAPDLTDCNVEADLLPRLCGLNIVCHQGAGMTGLDLASPDMAERLRDVEPAGPFCRDSGLKLIDSAQPDRSLLALKLTEMPPCGGAMPVGSGPAAVPEADLACLHAYVLQVARCGSEAPCGR